MAGLLYGTRKRCKPVARHRLTNRRTMTSTAQVSRQRVPRNQRAARSSDSVSEGGLIDEAAPDHAIDTGDASHEHQTCSDRS